MKKLLTLLLAVVMAATVLTGCAGQRTKAEPQMEVKRSGVRSPLSPPIARPQGQRLAVLLYPSPVI